MMKKYFLIAVSLVVLSSCNIYRTIQFNEDHSGHVENKIDMSSMMALLNEEGGGNIGAMGGMEDLQQMDLIKKQLESTAGVSNVQVSFDSTGIIYSSYDFTNTEALQNAMGSTGSNANMVNGVSSPNDQGPQLKLTYKGKKFYLEEISKKTLQKMMEKGNTKDLGQMDMLAGSSTIYTSITFPADVKRVSYKNAAITNNRTVTYNMSLKEMFSKEYKPLTILLK